MIENIICMKQLSLPDVILNIFFVLTFFSEINNIRQFIKIPFITKGIEFIDLPSIFPHNNVISAIPSYFEKTESPIICYKHNKPIRNTILNFNKLVSDLHIETTSLDS